MRHEGDAILGYPISGHIARHAAHPPVAARAGRQFPVADCIFRRHLDHEVAEPVPVAQMTGEPVAILARQEQFDQRHVFERLRRSVRCHGKSRRYVAQPPLAIDGPEPVGRLLLVVVQQHAHSTRGLAAGDLGLGTRQCLAVLCADRSGKCQCIYRQQDQRRPAGPPGLNHRGSGHRQRERHDMHPRRKWRSAMDQHCGAENCHGNHREHRRSKPGGHCREIGEDESPVQRPCALGQHQAMPLPIELPERRRSRIDTPGEHAGEYKPEQL